MTTTSSVREDRFGSRVPPIGSVLRWRHQGITHVAIHVGPAGASDPRASWRTTAGRSDSGTTTWEHISSLIGNNPCSIATGWGEVPLMSVVDFGDTDVAAFVDQLDTRPRAVDVNRDARRS